MTQTNNRNIFKSVQIKEKTYLYPTPVIKELKYLIEVEKKFAVFFIKSLENRYLISPDTKPMYLIKSHLHEDNLTWIFKFDLEKIMFEFLPKRIENLESALKTEKIISQKIIRVLMFCPNAESNLKRIFDNQLKCKTCQSLGIDSAAVLSWINTIYI